MASCPESISRALLPCVRSLSGWRGLRDKQQCLSRVHLLADASMHLLEQGEVTILPLPCYYPCERAQRRTREPLSVSHMLGAGTYAWQAPPCVSGHVQSLLGTSHWPPYLLPPQRSPGCRSLAVRIASALSPQVAATAAFLQYRACTPVHVHPIGPKLGPAGRGDSPMASQRETPVDVHSLATPGSLCDRAHRLMEVPCSATLL